MVAASETVEAPARRANLRAFWVRVHRYAGLAMAAFLVIAGLTGSVLAFQSEIDAWLNPALFRSSGGADRLPVAEVIARAEQADPRFQVTYIKLAASLDESHELYGKPRTDPASGQSFELGYDQVFMDPATGQLLGRRLWGACCFERSHLVPFLYKLHYSLHVPGNFGLWLMGIVALIWAFDCFVGAYLTLPRQAPRWQKWRGAWLVRSSAGGYRLNFDLHRAGGLWAWGLLLVLAVSAVAFNLRKEVFEPVVSLFSPLTPTMYDRPSAAQPVEARITFDEAAQSARAEAELRGWNSRVERIYYSDAQGMFGVRLGEKDAAGFGNPWLYVDGVDGHFIGADVPGSGTAGDLFVHIQYPLHSGQVAGIAGRIVICAAGLATAVLSITGVVIWLRKRRPGRAIERSPSNS